MIGKIFLRNQILTGTLIEQMHYIFFFYNHNNVHRLTSYKKY